MSTDTKAILAELAALRDTVTSLQTSLAETRDTQAIQHLLNHYTALHDDACFDLTKRAEWESLFCEDGTAIYPYGSHTERQGIGTWAFSGVAYFQRCQLLSSNFDISFAEGRNTAFVRSNCIAQWMRRKEVLDEHFDEGGFYQWVLRREGDGWRIERVQLTITWTTGEDPSGVGGKSEAPEKLQG